MDEDLALLDRWCAGDAAAGNDLFRRHFATLYRFFEHKTDGEVDDLVQETFLQCIRSRASFQRQSTFRTYLFAIARHVLFQHWRKRATARPTIDFDEISIESLSTSAGSRLAKHAERARLLAALRGLPVDQQLLLEMYYWEDLERDPRIVQLAGYHDDQALFGARLIAVGHRIRNARGGVAPQRLQHGPRALGRASPIIVPPDSITFVLILFSLEGLHLGNRERHSCLRAAYVEAGALQLLTGAGGASPRPDELVVRRVESEIHAAATFAASERMLASRTSPAWMLASSCSTSPPQNGATPSSARCSATQKLN